MGEQNSTIQKKHIINSIQWALFSARVRRPHVNVTIVKRGGVGTYGRNIPAATARHAMCAIAFLSWSCRTTAKCQWLSGDSNKTPAIRRLYVELAVVRMRSISRVCDSVNWWPCRRDVCASWITTFFPVCTFELRYASCQDEKTEC
jgi:hypothetical protein